MAAPGKPTSGESGADPYRGSVDGSAIETGTRQATAATVEAVWRIESVRLVASLSRWAGDVGLAEEMAQEAMVRALEQWPETGVPDNPSAWLLTTAKNRGIDRIRRDGVLQDKYGLLAGELERSDPEPGPEESVFDQEQIGDDVLTLLFTACHLALTTESQVALTLKAGEQWMRTDLSAEALRLGRILAGLAPAEPEVHGLVSLMEIQASRFPARIGPDGEPVLLMDQDRSRWDRLLIRRGLERLEMARSLGGSGSYFLQASIAACHASAATLKTPIGTRSSGITIHCLSCAIRRSPA
ncbi:MAG: polymerase sigma factor [Actinomycetota bacterium]|nr:polymerase sigma factor [Actinomycetota bacterium]